MSESSHAKKSPLLSDRTYDILKKATTLVLPALGALYFALAQIWNLPKPEEVVGTIAAVNTFFGVVLGYSSHTYNQSGGSYVGEIKVEDDGLTKKYSLVVDGDPESIEKMNEATFKVSKGESV